MCNSFAMGYLMNYNNELFPSSVRGFSLGLSLFLGRMLMATFPFINGFLDKHDFHRLSPSIPFCIVCLLFCFVLPETLKISEIR